jgi:hypothetical protein
MIAARSYRRNRQGMPERKTIDTQDLDEASPAQHIREDL